MVKVNIPYQFREGPWGGTNQFLKALKKEFIKNGNYEGDLEKADVVLFNSYPSNNEALFDKVYELKRRNARKIVIYRLDGPISLYRGKDKELDKIIFLFNHVCADGVIFQTYWSKNNNKISFNIQSKYETVIRNGPDSEIFYKRLRPDFNSRHRIKLICTSWSSNVRKGFEIYKYLDDNLDFTRYQMTFVGNSPFLFKNIKHIKPVSSIDLAALLRDHHIFVTASRKDPCSNSLIEAMACGLPAVALNDGGHPELVRSGGEIFDKKEEVIEKIEKIVNNYQYYRSGIAEFSSTIAAKEYLVFFRKILDDVITGNYVPKQIERSTVIKFLLLKAMIAKHKVAIKLRSVLVRDDSL